MNGFAPSQDLFLARRAAAGHDDAWGQLVDRFGRRLFNVAFQFSASREEAEDLTQEIFLRLYQNLRSYRGEVPLIGWALRLSRNLCIDHYRKTRLERKWHQVADTVLEQVPSHRRLDEELEHRQRVEEVYEALAELPEDLSETVLLCDLQGWSLEEASAFLDLPLGTLKSRRHRARERLLEVVLAHRQRPRTAASEGQAPC